MGIPWESLDEHFIALTWNDVLEALLESRESLANDQEGRIVEGLAEFISFFGYRIFSGIDFTSISNVPTFVIYSERWVSNKEDFDYQLFTGIEFKSMTSPPDFSLRRNR